MLVILSCHYFLFKQPTSEYRKDLSERLIQKTFFENHFALSKNYAFEQFILSHELAFSQEVF